MGSVGSVGSMSSVGSAGSRSKSFSLGSIFFSSNKSIGFDVADLLSLVDGSSFPTSGLRIAAIKKKIQVDYERAYGVKTKNN